MGKVRHRVFEAADVSPVAVPRAPERRAAHRRHARVDFVPDHVIQHVLRHLVGMARPTRPHAENRHAAAGAGAHFRGDPEAPGGGQQQVGHLGHSTRAASRTGVRNRVKAFRLRADRDDPRQRRVGSQEAFRLQTRVGLIGSRPGLASIDREDGEPAAPPGLKRRGASEQLRL